LAVESTASETWKMLPWESNAQVMKTVFPLALRMPSGRFCRARSYTGRVAWQELTAPLAKTRVRGPLCACTGHVAATAAPRTIAVATEHGFIGTSGGLGLSPSVIARAFRAGDGRREAPKPGRRPGTRRA
jgi:hypothetical protein